MERRFHGGRYAGELRLLDHEFAVKYGTGRVIFVEHCNDLWAEAVPGEWIERVLAHCREWPENEYVFQTKNPVRYGQYLGNMPERRLLGCTIETASETGAAMASKAPPPYERWLHMKRMQRFKGERVFITVEPILAGSMELLADQITGVGPEFVNIGADSKGSDLPEPSGEDVTRLIGLLTDAGVEIREKRNLERLLG